MSELVAAAAAAMGTPEHLVERSAVARAAAEGTTVEAVLTAWAGGGTVPAGALSAPEPAPATPVDETGEVAEVPEVAPPVGVAASAAVPSAPVAPAAAAAVATPPAPDRVGVSEAQDYEAVVTVPTAGLTERPSMPIPRWLILLFVAVPLVGLTYLVSFAGGPNCGEGGQLSVDRLMGVVENCDGSEYQVSGAPGGVDIRQVIGGGTGVYTASSSCSSCHGAAGEGGTGPILAGTVLATFSMCVDHIEWVRLGTVGFEAANRTTYGDNGKQVGSAGQMPSFDNLTDEELRNVVFYERVVFGGQDPAEAVVDCGLAEPEEEGGEDADSADGGGEQVSEG